LCSRKYRTLQIGDALNTLRPEAEVGMKKTQRPGGRPS
jgi:hypothetical protein